MSKVAPLLLAVLLIAGLVGAFPAWGQTSASAPQAPLDVLPVGEAPVWREQVLALHREALGKLSEFEGKFNSARATPHDAGLVSQAAAAQWRLHDAAGRLEVLGEPCGFDYTLRSAALAGRVKTAARNCGKIRGFRLEAIELELKNLFNAQLSRLPIYKQLVASGKRVEAEGQLQTVLTNIHKLAVFLEDNLRYYQPFQELLLQIRPELDHQRRHAHEQALATITRQLQPALDQTRNDLVKCLAELSTGPCTWKDQKLSAIELAEQLPAELAALHIAALRVRGLQMAAFPPGPGTPERRPEIDAPYAALFEKVPELLEGLIQRSAAAAKPGEVAALHRRWLALLSHWGAANWDQAAVGRMQQSLDQLTAQEPALAKQASAYAAASGDYLRWRERTAQREARRKLKESPPLANWVTPLVRARDGKPMLLAGQAPLSDCSVLTPLDEVVSDCGPKLVGQPAGAEFLFAPPAQGHGVARYEQRLLALAALPPSARLAQAELRLRERLLCDALHEPLSLRAELALARARRGCFQAAGGVVQDFRILPLAAAYALAPDEYGGLAPLGALPREAFALDQRKQVALEARLQPTWVQHEAFVATVP